MTWQTVPAQYVLKSDLGYANEASIFFSFLYLEILSKEVFWSSKMKSIMQTQGIQLLCGLCIPQKDLYFIEKTGGSF